MNHGIRHIIGAMLLAIYCFGMVKPAMPMIEYTLFKESLTELFCVNNEEPDSQCEASCYLAAQLEEQEEEEEEKPSRLINTGDILITVIPLHERFNTPSVLVKKLHLPQLGPSLSSSVKEVFRPPSA